MSPTWSERDPNVVNGPTHAKLDASAFQDFHGLLGIGLRPASKVCASVRTVSTFTLREHARTMRHLSVAALAALGLAACGAGSVGKNNSNTNGDGGFYDGGSGPTDYGAQFVGTWVSPWFICSDSECTGGAGSELGQWTATITEPSLNDIVMDSQFSDNQATSVTCTNGYTITAGPGDTSILNGNNSPNVGALTYSGTYSCVATGIAACGGADLDATFTGAVAQLFRDGTLDMVYSVSQSCAGQTQVAYYVVGPLIKQ
jgi:hypothetical protein